MESQKNFQCSMICKASPEIRRVSLCRGAENLPVKTLEAAASHRATEVTVHTLARGRSRTAEVLDLPRRRKSTRSQRRTLCQYSENEKSLNNDNDVD